MAKFIKVNYFITLLFLISIVISTIIIEDLSEVTYLICA